MNFKKIFIAAVVVGMLGAAGAAYAATVKTPAEITAELTGKTVEEVYSERSTGKTCGTIANEAGKLDEFKTQMLEQKKIILDQRVAEGRLTQEQADNIYNTMQSHQAICDGTGNAGIGKSYGAGFGQGNGNGICDGTGMGNGAGSGMKNGAGMGSGRGINK